LKWYITLTFTHAFFCNFLICGLHKNDKISRCYCNDFISTVWRSIIFHFLFFRRPHMVVFCVGNLHDVSMNIIHTCVNYIKIFKKWNAFFFQSSKKRVRLHPCPPDPDISCLLCLTNLVKSLNLWCTLESNKCIDTGLALLFTGKNILMRTLEDVLM
jgi:hypothetical protein